MRWLIRGFVRLLKRLAYLFTVFFVAARMIWPVPSLAGRKPSQALPPSADTALGRALLPAIAEAGDNSGILPLRFGPDAFAARWLLIHAAERSIDVQYYIWQKDLTGLLLLDALRQAANRGVRVRLLVDDNGTADLDRELAALDTLPNMEVRIFNPFILRTVRLPSFAFDFKRLNRRMHNKSLTIDGTVTVIGGRNIGDIYFSNGADTNYFDLDILAVGRAAADVSTDFDGYWASASSFPAAMILAPAAKGAQRLQREAAEAAASPNAQPYLERVEASPLLRDLTANTALLEWRRVHLVSDDPAKGRGEVQRDQLMITRLGQIMGQPTQAIDLVSAYFIPAEQGTTWLTGLAAAGVQVRVLTNSLEATDVPSVHGGWLRYRDALLDGGIEVFELKSQHQIGAPEDRFGILGSSSTSLHAKTFTIDKARVFVGSFNFDPRSALLNCEMGFLIEDPGFAAEQIRNFDDLTDRAAYRVTRAAGGGNQWLEKTGPNSTRVHVKEPNTTIFNRAFVRVVSWLPIVWML